MSKNQKKHSPYDGEAYFYLIPRKEKIEVMRAKDKKFTDPKKLHDLACIYRERSTILPF